MAGLLKKSKQVFEMKKFLKELRQELRQLEDKEIDDIIQDYEEHFAVGKKKGRSEKELVKALGKPKTIAKQILADYHVQKADKKKSAKNMTHAVLAIAGLSFLNLVFVLGPFIALWSVLLSLFVTAASLVLSGVIVFIASFLPLPSLGIIEPGLISLVAILIAGIGALLFLGCIHLTRIFYNLSVKYLKWNVSLVKD